MRKAILFTIFLASTIFAAGGDTVHLSSRFKATTDNDTIFAWWWHDLADSIVKVVNGKLGNVNIAVDAKIAGTKLDSTTSIKFSKSRADTLKSDTGFVTKLQAQRLRADTIFRVDTAFITKLKATVATIDSGELRALHMTGSLGIGTASPGTLAEIKSTGNTNGLTVKVNNEPLIALTETGTGGQTWWLHCGSYTRNDFGIKQLSSSIDRLYIDSTGKVGVGTHTLSDKLQVVGGARLDSITLDGTHYIKNSSGTVLVKANQAVDSLYSTNGVKAARFYGPVTGNVTGNVSGSSESCNGNAATATTATTATGFNGSSFFMQPTYISSNDSVTADQCFLLVTAKCTITLPPAQEQSGKIVIIRSSVDSVFIKTTSNYIYKTDGRNLQYDTIVNYGVKRYNAENRLGTGYWWEW